MSGKIFSIAIAFVLLAPVSETTQAAGVQLGPAQGYNSELKGAGALLRLRVPFGGRKREPLRPVMGLTAGPMWQEDNGAFVPGRLYYVPSVEAGFSFKGDPVLRVGSIDLIKPDVEQMTDADHVTRSPQKRVGRESRRRGGALYNLFHLGSR